MITIKKVEQQEFFDNQSPTLFQDKEHSRYYYFLVFNKLCLFKFSAQSEITPIAKRIGEVIAVGIDQFVGFWDVTIGKKIKIIYPTSFFYNFFFSEKYIFIVCEVDIIILNINTLVEYKALSFSEYIENIQLVNNDIIISFMNGETEKMVLTEN